MAILPILVVPNPILKKKCTEIKDINDEIRKNLDDMLETMYDAPGIGLAGPQVGITKRMVVIDVSKDDEAKHPLKMINPKIVNESEDGVEYEEGCLSVPGQYATVERSAEVDVEYLDENGKEQKLHADGLLAICIQHELDHLDGVVFIDYLSRLKRNMIIKKVQKGTK
ncbi:MAG: peptide deformylase [Alphaproteobacteria bacterium]|nr:peptide deformylase [Alphaproteobacteria bacterium]